MGAVGELKQVAWETIADLMCFTNKGWALCLNSGHFHPNPPPPLSLSVSLCVFPVSSLCSVAAFTSSSLFSSSFDPQQDEYHMMHLVCASHSPPASPMLRSPSAANSSASDSSVSRPTHTHRSHDILKQCVCDRSVWSWGSLQDTQNSENRHCNGKWMLGKYLWELVNRDDFHLLDLVLYSLY